MNTMSTKIAIAAAALLATAALLPSGATPAKADTVCHHVAGVPHIVCTERTGGAAIGAANPHRQWHCYYLPTVADGRVNGLRRVCS
jgi:hypothetical protein